MTASRALSPELQLVFRAASPHCPGAELVALTAAVRDWHRCYSLANREVAAATLWRALRDADAPLPPDVEAALRKLALIGDLAMQRLSLRAQTTVRLFAKRSIPVLLLKGAAVGAMTDSTFRSRPMTDLDLLVRREDVARAREAVIDSGWPETTDPALLELLKDAHHLPHFLDPQMPGMRLELHVALSPDDRPFEFSEADIWRDAEPAAAPFTGASVPSPEHLLLHLCVHFAWQHTMAFGAWRTIRAIALIVDGRRIDWESFARQAEGAKAVTACYWTLRLAQRLAGLDIPRATLARLAPPTPGWLLNMLERHFIAEIAPGEGPASPSIKITRLLWTTALRPRWSGYRAIGRFDPEQRWERARGTFSTETVTARFLRHLAGYREWWHFFARTLLP